MIKINRIFSISLLLLLFLGNFTFGQKINQFDNNGKRTGTWKKNYKNGNIRYQGQFIGGKEVGVFKFYELTSPTQPTIIKEFSRSNDTAKVKFYSSNGKLKSQGKMLRKHRIGKWLYYFPNGDVMSEENYTNGELHGVLKNYYPNRKLTEETHYSNGKKHGTSKIYSETGSILEEVNYKNGNLDGEGKYYDLKGALKEKGMYKDGKRHGKWEFYIDGQVSKKKKEKLSEFKE
ncbi:toxin-antitoxin system YwqK family antitoxin [Tenacibaculum xiamenense]|uniref:toxin-antitoxin system YwqK family antitoxin n=1 Tax=Tenacibaculum xiamenense TaxID=1261553 RepID=UPI003896643C